MDKELIAERFRKGFETYNEQAVAQIKIADNFVTKMLMSALPDSFGNVLEVGCGTGIFTELLLDHFYIEHIKVNDLVESVEQWIKPLANSRGVPFDLAIGDIETIDLGDTPQYSMIASTSTFQWFSNLESTLKKFHNILESDGVLAFTTYGEDNFIELTSLGVNRLNYLTLDQLKKSVSLNYTPVCCEEEKIVVTFGSVAEMFTHLKETGVNGAGSNSGLSLRSLMDKIKPNSAGEYQLTYHSQYVVALKR